MTKTCVHFVGFRDDRYWNAVRIFGRPDFVHPRWDCRAAREIAPNDTIVFAIGTAADEPSLINASDIIEEKVYDQA